ncbi:uncharacterized protein RAG0_06209 [Rhynchosporium agropyri]|uniref:Uncharacterized protein n=1 Tax=Rhynchosporium agropyri TaxID=914238 RepID=A0A1E1KGA5_9HELO|nr:uncharacterized protein RAG0_06209 [Rhynchosporium agropyri]
MHPSTLGNKCLQGDMPSPSCNEGMRGNGRKPTKSTSRVDGSSKAAGLEMY